MSKGQIDNSCFAEKVALRVRNLPDGDCLKVLDAFHGEGVIWQHMKRKTGRIGQIVGIEKENGKGRGSIYGDNTKILPRLDLSLYDVIDLDAYGCPYKQIKAILENRTAKQGTVVFFTFIRTAQGGVDHEMLESAGFTKRMIKKSPMMFAKKAIPAFHAFLHAYGVRTIRQFQVKSPGSKKIYGCFIIDKK